MVLWWRLFYGTLGSRWCVALLRFLIFVADRVKPGAALAVLETRIGESWPRHVPGWVNIHMSALFWKLRRRSIPQDRRRPNSLRRESRPLRIGCFGAFSGALGFPVSLFEGFPTEHALFIYDMQYQGQLAPALEGLAQQYRPVNLETATVYSDAVRAAADGINADDLDLLLIIRRKMAAYDVLDRVTTPCIAFVCTGSDIHHHPNVDFNFYCQPEADFFPVGNDLFCGFTRRPVPGRVVYPSHLCYDPRDLDLTSISPRWEERRPLIVFHGSLYKLASEPFLDCLFGLMAELGDVEFAFMGKHWGDALRRVHESACRWGVGERVHYEGAFSAMRDAEGRITDPGWHRLVELLRSARLAPDPWPIGGASTRFEAYVLGAPTVHMGVRTDAASWGQPQPALLEVPNLLVPEGTTHSVDGYRALSVRCLRDGSFANKLAQLQRQRALDACVPSEYWQMILRGLDTWEEDRCA
ncbi:MAG TPA: hypothetical protein QGG30_10330 [Acidobacteriota bacterium]|nr:hypothetical protein [Acidobacteriota bacterium]|tara:strand:+ start:262 stop:1668 length:1407 start_codon:yes stop_codon:yes gene_type:complete